MADPVGDPRSLPQLAADLAGDLSTLVRKEVQLARAELSQTANRLGRAAMEGAAGAVLLLLGAYFLLQALVVALARLMGGGWASLLVGAALCAAGVGALLLSRQAARKGSLQLPRSQEQLRETVRAARESTQ